VPPARRGPGERGSARRVAGDSTGPAGAFAAGQVLDVAPGGGALHGLAECAAGPGDRFAGATEDELTGVICALDRAEAAACSLKHAAVAGIADLAQRGGLRTGCLPGRRPVRRRSDRSLGFFLYGLSDNGGLDDVEDSLA